MSVVWQLSLPLMNNFNKTEPAIFTMQAMLPKGFPLYLDYFSDINKSYKTMYQAEVQWWRISRDWAQNQRGCGLRRRSCISRPPAGRRWTDWSPYQTRWTSPACYHLQHTSGMKKSGNVSFIQLRNIFLFKNLRDKLWMWDSYIS